MDFVDPATKNDDAVVTLHSLLDRDVYRGGAIVVGPVRRGRGRRVRVERRVLPVAAERERRFAVFERELWRIAVEYLDPDERHLWAALAGARVTPSGWRRARTMLHFDRSGELKRRFLLTAMERNRNLQVRIRALADIAALRDADAFDTAVDIIGGWPREERKEATKIMLRALAERRIGRRDQATAWIRRLAEYTREVHEEYATQRWPETKRLLGLLVNSAGQRARAQRAAARPRGAQAGPPARGGAARGGARADALPRGGGGAARGVDAHGAQADVARARPPAQLPEAPHAWLASQAPRAERGGGRRGACERHRRGGASSAEGASDGDPIVGRSSPRTARGPRSWEGARGGRDERERPVDPVGAEHDQ